MKLREYRLASGRVTFRVDYSIQGKRVQRTVPGHEVVPLPDESEKAFEARVRKALKAAQEDAELLYHEQRRRVALGELAGPSPRERSLTVDEALKEFAERDGLAPQTRLHYQDKAKLIVDYFGKDRKLSSISSGDVLAFAKAYRAEGTKHEVKASTVNKPLRVLKAAFRYLKELGDMSNPPRVDLLPESEPRRRFLTEEEAGRLLAAIEPGRFRDVIIAYLNTGLRKTELFRIRRRDVDFQEKVLAVETRKRGSSLSMRRDRIPLNETVLEIFKRYADESSSPDDYLFGRLPESRDGRWVMSKCATPKKPGHTRGGPVELQDHNLNRKLKLAARKAGIERPNEISIHALRHTFASCALRRGATVRDVQALLRHRSPMLTLEIYCHEGMDTMRSTVDTLKFVLPTEEEEDSLERL